MMRNCCLLLLVLILIINHCWCRAMVISIFDCRCLLNYIQSWLVHQVNFASSVYLFLKKRGFFKYSWQHILLVEKAIKTQLLAPFNCDSIICCHWNLDFWIDMKFGDIVVVLSQAPEDDPQKR